MHRLPNIRSLPPPPSPLFPHPHPNPLHTPISPQNLRGSRRAPTTRLLHGSADAPPSKKLDAFFLMGLKRYLFRSTPFRRVPGRRGSVITSSVAGRDYFRRVAGEWKKGGRVGGRGNRKKVRGGLWDDLEVYREFVTLRHRPD